jgi:hypothetical protein
MLLLIQELEFQIQVSKILYSTIDEESSVQINSIKNDKSTADLQCFF